MVIAAAAVIANITLLHLILIPVAAVLVLAAVVVVWQIE
jgi:hypothetical protein